VCMCSDIDADDVLLLLAFDKKSIIIITIAILKATVNRKPLILSADITVPAMPHRPFKSLRAGD